MKLQKLDDLLLNLVVVFEARRIKGVTPLRAAEAAGYPRKARENKRSHTDSISQWSRNQFWIGGAKVYWEGWD